MRLRLFVALPVGALAILSLACSSNRTTTLTSGIQGQVLLGPQCPVVREGSPCPDLPYQATIAVWNASRTEKSTAFATDEQGRFRIPLAPGDYYIDPQPASGGRPLPRPVPQTVTVFPGQFVQVTIQYDSGIR